MDYELFIRERIPELRLNADISEYQLSHEIGHAHSYINGITRGKALPAMKEFLALCEYFGITPSAFFDPSIEHPELYCEIEEKLKRLYKEDLETILRLLKWLERER